MSYAFRMARLLLVGLVLAAAGLAMANQDAGTDNQPARDAGADPTPTPTFRRFSYAEGSKLFAQVQPGWTATQVEQLLGKPPTVAEDRWLYLAGHRDGPRLQYEYTLRDGVVVSISRSALGCVLYE